MHEKALIYPLEQVLGVKRKRVETAERLVAEKTKILERENEKLKRVKEERDKIRRHYKDKLEQLRDALDRGVSTDKIQMIRYYLDSVGEKLAIHEEKVTKQQLEVDQAKTALEQAQEAWRARMKEEDKLTEHKRQWTKLAKLEQAAALAKEQDEIGSIVFMSHKNRYT